MRYHRPRYVLLLYYPHEVTPDMGPTALVPKTQYYMDGPSDEVEGLALTCATGTVVITHYELWHRATANRSTRTRYMLKFLFARTQEGTPEQTQPVAAHGTPRGSVPHAVALVRRAGSRLEAAAVSGSPTGGFAATPDEQVRIDAYYDLGDAGSRRSAGIDGGARR